MDAFYSIVPPIVAIIGAMVTKRIIPSLISGLLAGAFLKSGSLIGTIALASSYLAKVIANEDNAYIILFLFCFGALAEIFKVGGGIAGFAKKAEGYVKSGKGALLSVWAATPLTFLDCCFHVISTGTIAKPLIEKIDGSREKLGVIINTTSSQLIVLIPFATTYVGYILGTIASSMSRAGITGKPYSLYLSSIFLNFYSISMIIISILLTFWNFRLFKIAKHYNLKEGEHHSHAGHEESEFAQKAPPRIANLLIPLIFLLFMITYLAWWTQRDQGITIWQAIMEADFGKVIFFSTLATLIFTAILYSIQKIPMAALESNFLAGGTEMLPPIVVLVLAWAITGITQDLGFNSFIKTLIGASFPSQLIPVTIFAIGGLSSYFMGSSWGTWALIMPLALSLTVTTGANLPLTIGAVLAGGSIGDNLSPLGETPVLTAATLGIPIAEHINYILPYGLIAIAVSLVLYLIAGYIV